MIVFFPQMLPIFSHDTETHPSPLDYQPNHSNKSQNSFWTFRKYQNSKWDSFTKNEESGYYSFFLDHIILQVFWYFYWEVLAFLSDEMYN